MVGLDTIALKTGLLGFVIPSNASLRVLVLESCLYLPELRELLPKGELYAVVKDETVADLEIYQGLDIHWSFVDFCKEELIYPAEYFDYVIGERCLELAGDPKQIAEMLRGMLKETGYFLSTFQNVRYWEILQDLMAGQFAFLRTRPFSKADYTRLLGSSLFKDVVYAPQKVKAPVDLLVSLQTAGFDNSSDDLEVAVWMVKAAKSEPEILELKRLYTPALRNQLAIILRRIEYSIDITENTKFLAELCDREGIVGFDGWHFYDVSQCMEMSRAGYRTAVPYQRDFWCIHCPKEKPLDPVYYQYQKVFLKEYRKELGAE